MTTQPPPLPFPILHPPAWKIAWLAIRPRTLSISVAPVIVGSSLAWAEGSTLHWLPLLAALCCAMLIQIGTNVHNDAVDCEKGNDRPDRPGPLRVTAAGWVKPGAMRRAALGSFAAAFLLGIYLAFQGGWPIIAIGLASLLAGWAYSGGPRPISYTPLGEVFVLFFFGIFAVGGCVWLQGARPGITALLAGLVCGLPAAAVLVVNNTRDRRADLRVGRRTLAALLSRAGATRAYAALMLLPFPLLLVLSTLNHPGALLALLALPNAGRKVRAFERATADSTLNPLLPATARSGLGLALLLSAGLLLELR
ncbi:MAG: 1,4-dihydroxy-2-naphthoate polyprenyltransferase [Bacteroidota bacterium]